MRCWLLRLGFIGDEFATARGVFTNRLPSDTAWRNGRPSQAAVSYTHLDVYKRQFATNVVGIRAEADTFTIGIIFKDKSVSL